jgi:Kef-type K+ transport system membrane component KefB
VTAVSPDELMGRLLVDIAIVVLVARVFALALRKLREPPVMAEILAGIALGPTLLGALPGDLSSELFPEEVRSVLAAVGGIGLVLFMFIIGLELNVGAIRRQRRVVPAISVGALALPLGIGVALAFVLFGSHGVVNGHHVPLVPFVLFIATALSITAFPVLARILSDRGLDGTPIGGIALAVAAVQDTVGWILLAAALAVHTGGGSGEVFRIGAEAAAFIAVMLGVVRPLLQRFVVDRHSEGPVSLDVVAIVVAGLVASAGATQLIGLHSVLGAFFFGVIFPRRERPEVAAGIERALRPATMAVLPIYFLVPGLNVNVGGIGGNGVAEIALILACACTAKLVGAGLGARVAGLGRRESTMMGVLMNTRGLIELIVLNVALTAGILDQRLFSELVVMALVTTLMAPPLLDFVRAPRRGLAMGREPLLSAGKPKSSA